MQIGLWSLPLGPVEFAVLAISSIIAVMEPFSTIAIYVTLTKNESLKKQREIAAKSMRISFLVLAFFALTGHLLFLVFNISIYSFKIAGGILLVAVALRMLNPQKTQYSSEERENIAVVPLAFPLTSGPGAITAVILLVSEASSFLQASFVFVGIFIGVVISYLGMIYSSKMTKILGDDGLKVVTALMSIIVLAIAVQFVINGIQQAFSNIIPTK